MQKCGNCLSLMSHAVGDRGVDGWLRADPTGLNHDTIKMTQTPLVCASCMTRWQRTKLKPSGAVRWSEVGQTGRVIW
jgi:hypothetical protein